MLVVAVATATEGGWDGAAPPPIAAVEEASGADGVPEAAAERRKPRAWELTLARIQPTVSNPHRILIILTDPHGPILFTGTGRADVAAEGDD